MSTSNSTITTDNNNTTTITDNSNNISDGRLTRPTVTTTSNQQNQPQQLPFHAGFSKEHPSQHTAFTGTFTDLLIPFCKATNTVCYHDLYLYAKNYGILEKCPTVPRFENCNVLFDAMHDVTNENYNLYRVFVSWWTDVIGRMILTAAVTKNVTKTVTKNVTTNVIKDCDNDCAMDDHNIVKNCKEENEEEKTIHFNLAGYTKERLQIICDRYNKLLSVEENCDYLQYHFINELNVTPFHTDNNALQNIDNTLQKNTQHVTNKYKHVPHLKFNTKWTSEEKEKMKLTVDEIYPGFTDWDLGFILRDERILKMCKFYCINNVKELEEQLLLNNKLIALTKDEVKEIYGIEL
ncbi:hypothetical protein ABK040_008319 [Willaertia magna]